MGKYNLKWAKRTLALCNRRYQCVPENMEGKKFTTYVFSAPGHSIINNNNLLYAIQIGCIAYQVVGVCNTTRHTMKLSERELGRESELVTSNTA